MQQSQQLLTDVVWKQDFSKSLYTHQRPDVDTLKFPAKKYLFQNPTVQPIPIVPLVL